MEFNKSNILAVLIVILVLTVLVVTGPAQAFILNLSVSDQIKELGEKISFIADVEVEPSEIVDIKNFTLVISGPETISCSFLPDGTLLGTCPNIQIQLLESSSNKIGYSYGYGYGYGYGNNCGYGYGYGYNCGYGSGILKYNITLSTNNLSSGEYLSQLFATTPQTTYSTSEQTFLLISEGDSIEKCVIRAEKGEAILNKTVFASDNKLYFGVPESRANSGQGYLQSRKGNNKLFYNFKVDKAYLAAPNVIVLEVTGNLKVGLTKKVKESAKIYFNTQTHRVSLQSPSLEVNDLRVSLDKC